jgi:tetratricopeptide (TPR) repeat protein
MSQAPDQASDAQRAQALIGARRFNDAIPLVRQAIAREPGAARPRCLLAHCLLNVGDPAGALEAADAAAGLEPESHWAHRLRALALLALKRRRQAVAAAREAVRLAPDQPMGYIVLVDTELASRHYRAAEAAAQRARELAPDQVGGHNALGVVSLRKGRPREAETHFRAALAIDPKNAPARNNLGVAVLRQGHRRQAIQHFAEASRLDPRHDKARRNATRAAGVGSGVVAVIVVGQLLAAGGSPNAVVAVIALAGAGFVIYRWRHALVGLVRRDARVVSDPKASPALMKQLRKEAGASGVRPAWLARTLALFVFGAASLGLLVALVAQLTRAPVSLATLVLSGGTLIVATITVCLVGLGRR